MPSIDEINKQLKDIIGAGIDINRPEVKALPEVLQNDEKILNAVQGIYNNGYGILIATNKRLAFVEKGVLFGMKVDDFPYDKITSIQHETGLLMGKIKIFSHSNKAIIDNIPVKQRAIDFAEFVRDKIASPLLENDSEDVFVKLKKLGELRNSGIVTEEEFQEKKKYLLSLIK